MPCLNFFGCLGRVALSLTTCCRHRLLRTFLHYKTAPTAFLLQPSHTTPLPLPSPGDDERSRYRLRLPTSPILVKISTSSSAPISESISRRPALVLELLLALGELRRRLPRIPDQPTSRGQFSAPSPVLEKNIPRHCATAFAPTAYYCRY